MTTKDWFSYSAIYSAPANKAILKEFNKLAKNAKVISPTLTFKWTDLSKVMLILGMALC